MLRERELVECGPDLGDAEAVGLPGLRSGLVGLRRRREELSEIGDAELRHLHALGMVQAAGSRRCYSLDFRRTDLGYTEGVLREFERNSHPSLGFTKRNQRIRNWVEKFRDRNCSDTTCYDLDLCPRVTPRQRDLSLDIHRDTEFASARERKNKGKGWGIF